MTITATAPSGQETPAGLALGFLTGGVIGASLTAFIGGCVVGSAPLVITGLVLPAVYGLLFFLATLPRRAREAAVVPRTALAVIEDLTAVGGGETSDVPVRFELSVVPDDAPAFRVETRQDINLVELAAYRPRGTVVVAYPPDRPWKTRIVRRPTPEWEDRAAEARLDSVPGPPLRKETRDGCLGGSLTLLGLLLGTAAVLFAFRADLFDSTDPANATGTPSATRTSSSSSSSSTSIVVTSATGTVTLGPGADRSLFDPAELRRAVQSLTRDKADSRALTLVVQERVLTLVFSPTGVKTTGFDPRTLPYDRIPRLVEEATTTLGDTSPRTRQLTADAATGALRLRVVVTGDGGTATVEADGRGTVLNRTGG
ncbi:MULTISPECIES: hypothetical protein [unclassified Streptomyces]|uniref:hypothetical protein n=1 Tax=unclassified Streptomyces TaxID=2593676 RepID=UPI00381F8827